MVFREPTQSPRNPGAYWIAQEAHRGPVEVPAGETFRYECTVHVREPGPFDLGIAVFLEDGGTRTVTLGVKGTGVAR